MLQLQNYINGQWRPTSTGRYADNLNPARLDEVICQYPLSSVDELEEAVAAAKVAQKAWAQVPAPVRGQIMFKAVHIMERRAEELALALTHEEGKLLKESRGEVGKAMRYLEFAAGDARRLNGQVIPSEMASTMAYTLRTPLGVVGMITPWNFPVAIVVWKIAPALVCGNAVVLKPAEQTPLTAKLIVEVFEEAGVPPGVLNLVFGLGEEVGAAMVDHPGIAAISFTGSTEVGKHIYSRSAELKKKCQCEMGGKNAVLVLEDADIELAARGTVMGAFGSTGQRCTATSRVIIHRSVHDAFVERMLQLTSEMVIGDGMDPGAGMGPSIDQAQLDTVMRYIDIARAEGATFACGGERATDGELARGLFVQPTLLTGVHRDMRIAREEVFGPVLAVIAVDSLEEALSVANDVPFGLTSSIYTRDVNAVFHYIDAIETGMVHINSPTVGGEAQLPFGGIKDTGVGEREMGPTAMDFFTELKTVYIDYTGAPRTGNLY